MKTDIKRAKNQAPVQSLARAFSILTVIAEHRDGISLSDLSKRVGLHSSTTFHLVRSLVALGCARQDDTTKHYFVGSLLFSVAAAALDEAEMARIADDFLDEIAMEVGETSHLAIRNGAEVAVIARKEASSPFRITERAGAIRPAHATALGKVLLSAMPENNLSMLLDTMTLSVLTPKTITDRRKFERELASVRKTGIGIDDTEFHPEVRCVAVPVTNFTGTVVSAIGISAPIYRLSLKDLQAKADFLLDVADRLSRELGKRGETA